VRPTDDEIRAQLGRMLGSEGFANADRMSEFLRFVVARALAGEGDQVKEYVIGVEVFQRNADYDPRLDSIVRVEARRLRSKIEEYYAGPGREDQILIRIPRGSYVPTFETREVAAPTSAPALASPLPASSVPVPVPAAPRRTWRVGAGIIAVTMALLVLVAWRSGLWATNTSKPAVTVAVLPFAQYSPDSNDRLFADALTDRVTSELARHKTVGVVSHTSSLHFADGRRSVAEIARALHADVVMEATVKRSGEIVRVDARLVDGATDRKFWIEDFSAPASELQDLAKRIAAGTAAAAMTRRRQ
jgi:TolB-like protein